MSTSPVLNAHYFLQHTYTLVPRQIHEDFSWIRDAGAGVVTIGCLEQDLFAARANFDQIFAAAERAGLKVFVIPSRWGGFIAGAPKVPSIFASLNPETWALDENGAPQRTPFGPICSVHHPDTFALFKNNLKELLEGWPVAGLIWDEPKALLRPDHSPMARGTIPPDAPPDRHTAAFAGFFDRVGGVARALRPDLTLAMFLHGQLSGRPLECCASLTNLDVFGLDARPWRLSADQPRDTGAERVRSLLDDAPRFFECARRHGKATMMLLENHNMPHEEDLDLMEQRLPEVLELRPDYLHFYYYPRNVADPDRQMRILARGFQRAFH